MAARTTVGSANRPLRKLALVIGIGEYEDGQNLHNAENDAKEMSSALKTMGFLIEGDGPKLNLKYKDMYCALVDFEGSIEERDMVVFYFVGHGRQWKDQNYLIPADNLQDVEKDGLITKVKISGSELRERAINVQNILSGITAKKPFVTIFLMDCCLAYHLHDKDLVTHSEVEEDNQPCGLKPMFASAGSLIAFACAPETVANDKKERDKNGLFTKHLLKHIITPNEDIRMILADVTRGMMDEPDSDQLPYINAALKHRDIFLYVQGPDLLINISYKAQWKQNGVTVAGGNGRGNALNQLKYPYGLYVDDDQTVYVADYWNHRIMKWKSGATRGEVVAGGNGKGNRIDQLNYPTDVIVDKETDSLIICDNGNRRVMRCSLRSDRPSGEIIIENIKCCGLTMDNHGFLYITDTEKSEVRRYGIGETQGTVVAGGNGASDRLDQLNWPRCVFVDQDLSVYVSDCFNHRVMKWVKGAKEAIVVAGGHGRGTALTQLSHPKGVFVDQSGTVYVADTDNNRVMRWGKGMIQGNVIAGGNGQGGQENQLTRPIDLSYDQHGSLYIADCDNHRVQQFSLEETTN